MIRPVTFEAAAETELWASASHYESEQIGLGIRFLSEVERAVEQIQTFPEAWRPITSRSRRYRLHRFPFGLVYQIREAEITIIAVMHLHRDPGYWLHRET